MEIKKRECRKFADPGLKMNRNHGLLHAEEVKYIVRTAVKNIGGKRLLVLYIYLREQAAAGNFKPVWTMFQGRMEYTTLSYREDGSTYWRKAAFCNLTNDYDFSRRCAFYTSNDEERVIKFCKQGDRKGFASLYFLQSDIREKKCRQRRRKKEKEICKKMKTVPALPRNIEKIIDREIMPHYVFYIYNRKRKDMEGFCSACNKEVQVTDVRHNQKGICPVCKAAVTFKSQGKRGNIYDRETLQVFQRISENEIVVRFLKIRYQYWKKHPYKSVFENARTFLCWDGKGHTLEERFYYSYGGRDSLTPWRRGSRPVFCQWKYNFEADPTGFLYDRNLDRVLKGSPWQYCQLKKFYLADREPLYAISYLAQYERYPMLEYLVKLRLYRLAGEVVYSNHYYGSPDSGFNPNGKNLKEVFGFDKSYLPLLQRVNPGIGQMRLIKTLIHKKTEVNEELLRWCGDCGISRAENILVPLKHMTPYRLMKYVNEQYAKFCKKSPYQKGGYYYDKETILTDYRDYLCMSEGLELDLKNSFVLFPADLKKAHDKVNDISDKKQALLYDRQIQKQFEEMNQRYHFVKYGFAVLLPHTAKEILEEGQNLHHCVGSYVKKVVKRESTILFVRKVGEQGKSLCTIEIHNGELVQARCYGNEPPTPAIQRFLDIWEKKILHAPALAAAA